MQLTILKSKRIIFGLFLVLLTLGCNNKTDVENQITIKITSINKENKQHRINTFDTIEIRIKKIGFPTWRFVKVGECVTDSSGSVKIKIDKTEEYTFLLGRVGYFASETFGKESLKNNQEVNIEVFPIGDK